MRYSWLSLSQTHISRITTYLEVKIWSLPKDENLTTGNKILWKRGAISPLFHNIFNISWISRVQLHIHLLNVVVRFIFSSILQFWYVEVRISRSISESPMEFEIMRVDCIYFPYFSKKTYIETICCGYSSEPPQCGAFNEYPQHSFPSRDKKKCQFLDKHILVGQVDFDHLLVHGQVMSMDK